jgi:AcrR family transcriptional regulator
MAANSPSFPVEDTRHLILDAAGEIFAQNGFHATTVRQITRAAGVNIAAINYHFGDKKELYLCVLQRAYQSASRTAEADLVGPARERLRTFIRNFLGYLLDPKRPEWQGILIAREMARPSPALDRLVAESVGPMKRRIGGIVRELLGPGVPDMRVSLSCLSIIGQCLHYVHCREMIARLFSDGRRVTRDVDALAAHIYEFSLAGLNALKAQHRPLRAPRRLASRRKRTPLS